MPECLPCTGHCNPALASVAPASEVLCRRWFAYSRPLSNDAYYVASEDTTVEHANGYYLVEGFVCGGCPQTHRQSAFNSSIGQLPIEERWHWPKRCDLAARQALAQVPLVSHNIYRRRKLFLTRQRLMAKNTQFQRSRNLWI
jgi:hypothetical protein